MRNTWSAIAAGMLVGLTAAGCAAYQAQESTLPHAYLEQARQAASAHDAAKANAALDAAENSWLGANTPYGNPMMDYDPEALREIGRARQSVGMQRWGDALYYIDAALTHPSTIQP